MSGGQWLTVTCVWNRPVKPFHPAIESAPGHREVPSNYGRHIRGRIGRPGMRSDDGYAHYVWEVYNAETGKVLVTSDSFGLTDAIADCSRVVGIARAAASWSFWKPRKADR